MNMIALQIVFALVNFVLVAALLYKYAGPIVTKTLQEKHEATRRAIEEAEATQAKATSELEDYRKRLANVSDELATIVSQAKSMAGQLAVDVERNGQLDADRLRQQATAEIERERAIASQAIQRTLMQQALEAARAELQRQMTPDRQRQLVARFIQKVGDGSCAIKL